MFNATTYGEGMRNATDKAFLTYIIKYIMHTNKVRVVTRLLDRLLIEYAWFFAPRGL